ncbi:hypothetical protein FQN54_008148 [Arachnomyces sp. PD_36]|nr:hypothetical protein FQN54_008148 [Arachnomyces sp. PD_36]
MPLLQATSIEDYFSSSPIKKRKRSPDSHSPGNNDSSPTAAASSDSATDIDNGTRTNPHKWKPRVEYDEVQVSQLKPGFAGVRFVVKVVNVFEQGMKGAQGSRSNGNGSGNGARGCLKILGKGADGGVLMVHLYYADVPYDIGLGSVVTVWTPYISRVREEEKGGAEGAGAAATTATLGAGAGDGSAPISRSGYSAPSGSGAELMTSIFPERDGKCHVRIHRGEDANGLCRGVGGEGKVESLVGFMERMGRGGGTGGSGRVLVFVKAIGEVVTCEFGWYEVFVKGEVANWMRYDTDTNKQGRPTQKLDIGIADESGEAMLTLFGRMMASALKDWVPCSTILLITKPNCWGAHSSRLSVSARTMVEVDPEGMGEGGEWLARLAGWSGRGVNERFPEGGELVWFLLRGYGEVLICEYLVFDVEAVEEAVTRVKFTLADIDDFIRVGPKNQIYMGYLNVLLTEVNLVTMYKANRLFSAEWYDFLALREMIHFTIYTNQSATAAAVYPYTETHQPQDVDSAERMLSLG